MKLYTKTGDDGTTGLFGGTRVSKNHPKVAAYGEVDELNAFIGAATAACKSADTRQKLLEIQADLFHVGAELATPSDAKPVQQLEPGAIARMELWIDQASDATPELRTFILPGGSPAAAQLHVARGVCRRAERALVSLTGSDRARPELIVYLNRLSDLLFALARVENQAVGVADVPWNPPRRT
ncbi:MAG: cob(I)yrinic acid a,c-diamide adenosyltransferase [Planctomycetes bacterium]|nr:cob(I)yrinic acid a,c-diamide adenosyltransferase [Planctomycetota bacterium]MBI3833497.1 cob(I)yrinic acid a,c-diamide adenosyltransferase [Planctomycetota bacterium]